MAKMNFVATLTWKEEVPEDAIKETFAEENDGTEPNDDEMADLVQDWLGDRKNAIEQDLLNIPDDAILNIEIDEVSK